ncbi:MAG: TIGR00730 family Rossman fold protein [Acidiferrobacterales bacterium]|nr:TIGR00730 family Rossman fold protein [Acidiferrobacterales bacterium]
MQICVFLGSQSGQSERYQEDAQKMGRYLASRNIGLVYGGASIGLMGTLARSAMEAGGKVTGVIPRQLLQVEVPEDSISELIYVDTLAEREHIMFERSDAFIALPGGFGTLEELFTVLVWNMLKYHDKPVGMLNTSGYYEVLKQLLAHQQQQGFVSQQWVDSIIIEDEVESLVDTLVAMC